MTHYVDDPWAVSDNDVDVAMAGRNLDSMHESDFFCTSGGAMCAGFAQVTSVELRSSCQQGCEAKRNNKKQPTKHKAARATFKVTRGHEGTKKGETGR